MSNWEDRRLEDRRLDNQRMAQRLSENRLAERRLADKREFERIERRRFDDRRLENRRVDEEQAREQHRREQEAIRRAESPLSLGGWGGFSGGGHTAAAPAGESIGSKLVAGALLGIGIGLLVKALTGAAQEEQPSEGTPAENSPAS